MISVIHIVGARPQFVKLAPLYHQMNNDLETQIIGRANRIGRQIQLRVHHLI